MSAGVNNFYRRHIGRICDFTGSDRQITILEIEEELIIEAACLSKDSASEKHETSAYNTGVKADLILCFRLHLISR